MTINERVSPETLDKIIEAADEVITALAGTNEDVHKNDSAKMCQLWDDLNDRHATPAIVKALARELQQYRAAAELEVSNDELNAALTVHRLKTDGHSQLSDAFRAGYKYAGRAAPQVTSVPVMVDFNKLARELVEYLVDCNGADDSAVKQYQIWAEKTCRAAMLNGGKS